MSILMMHNIHEVVDGDMSYIKVYLYYNKCEADNNKH